MSSPKPKRSLDKYPRAVLAEYLRLTCLVDYTLLDRIERDQRIKGLLRRENAFLARAHELIGKNDLDSYRRFMDIQKDVDRLGKEIDVLLHRD